MKTEQGKTGHTPARTSNQTDRRNEAQPNVQELNKGQNPRTETDANKEPKRFEEQPIKPDQQPQGSEEQRRTPPEKSPVPKNAPGSNGHPTDEKYQRDEDQYLPGHDSAEDEIVIEEGHK